MREFAYIYVYESGEELNPRNGCEGKKVRDMVPATKAIKSLSI